MKTKLSLLALASILFSQLCLAQDGQDKPPADDWKPSAANIAGQETCRLEPHTSGVRGGAACIKSPRCCSKSNPRI